MTKKENRLIKLRLQAHLKLMLNYVAVGATKKAASKQAYVEIAGLSEKDLLLVIKEWIIPS